MHACMMPAWTAAGGCGRHAKLQHAEHTDGRPAEPRPHCHLAAHPLTRLPAVLPIPPTHRCRRGGEGEGEEEEGMDDWDMEMLEKAIARES